MIRYYSNKGVEQLNRFFYYFTSSTTKFSLFVLYGLLFMGIVITIVFLQYIYDQEMSKSPYGHPPLKHYFYHRDEQELVHVEDLNLPQDVKDCFELYGAEAAGHGEGWPVYDKYKYIERTETYDVVEDEYGFQYKDWKCPGHRYQTYFSRFHFWRGILSVWSAYAKKLDIEWYLFYGPLIGVYRDKTFLAWDFDVDIIVNKDDIWKLQKHISPFALDHWFLWVHPDHELHPRDRKIRYKCPPNFPTDKLQPGKCNFNGPVARWIHSHPYCTFLDIFGFVRDKERGRIFVEEGNFGFLFYESQFQKLNCTYFGVEMNCPSGYDDILTSMYGDWRIVPYECDLETKHFVKVDNDNLHTKVPEDVR